VIPGEVPRILGLRRAGWDQFTSTEKGPDTLRFSPPASAPSPVAPPSPWSRVTRRTSSATPSRGGADFSPAAPALAPPAIYSTERVKLAVLAPDESKGWRPTSTRTRGTRVEPPGVLERLAEPDAIRPRE